MTIQSSGGYARVPRLGHPPIAMWDVEHGMHLTSAGILVGWEDIFGTMACPISQSMAIETSRFSGSRKALAFNGTSGGLRAWLEALRRTSDVLAFHVQLVTADNAATYREICHLSSDGSPGRLEIFHPATVNYLQATGSTSTNNVTATTGWIVNTELIVSAVRVANTRLELFINGASVGSTTDETLGLPQVGCDFIVGHTANTTNTNFFYGSIRRIAVYNVAHTATEAAIVDAAWRGL